MIDPIRALATAVAVTLAVSGCGSAPVTVQELPRSTGGPPGTVQLSGPTNAAEMVARLQEAITANGGTVTAVVDHAADARASGVGLGSNTVVIGGPAAAHAPFVRINQQAVVNLPQRYLVRQEPGGPVTVTYNGSPYLAALGRITQLEAQTVLRDSSAAVAAAATGDTAAHTPSALVGVTPVGYLRRTFGSAGVPTTVGRLRNAADVAPARSIAEVDMSAASAGSGPAVPPTTVVLVSIPEAEAPLLAAAPTVGLDLPLQYVVFLDDQDRTQIVYPDLRRIAFRHDIPDTDPAVQRLAGEVERLARLGAGIDE